jgi:hypothetical protein
MTALAAIPSNPSPMTGARMAEGAVNSVSTGANETLLANVTQNSRRFTAPADGRDESTGEYENHIVAAIQKLSRSIQPEETMSIISVAKTLAPIRKHAPKSLSAQVARASRE